MLDDFIDLLLPRHCSGCRRLLVKGEPQICTHCRSRISVSDCFRSPQENELMNRLKGRLPLSHAVYYTWFRKSGVVQELLHALKYEGREETGLLLGTWFGYEMRRQLMHLEFDYLVPVPMHKSKERKRGYNQSLVLARGISNITEIPICEMLERKIKGTTQTRLNRWQRWKNSELIYCENEKVLVKNSRILLVDDVMTTGATAEACIQRLLNAGVKSAGVAALALAM